jgi:hypothetical protein
LGEEGVDQGGPYRSYFTEIGEELMSVNVPVFLPSANQSVEAGECRECWVLNPTLETAAGTPGHRMLTFLGRLMGTCLLRGDILAITVSGMFWKGLINEPLGLSDLETVDSTCAKLVKTFEDMTAAGITRELFEEQWNDFKWITEDSGHQQIPLVPGGETKAVTFEDAPRYAQRVLQCRLHESDAQLAVVKAGLLEIVAAESFALWSWRTLETRVVGVAEIDIALLRRKSRYSGWDESAPTIKYFWEALEGFSQEDRKHYLLFIWGRTRLPPENSPLWGAGMKIARRSERNTMPHAHTCFFQIDLPEYENKDICRERVLFAIRNCISLAEI